MIVVYRIEDEDKHGMYTSYNRAQHVADAINNNYQNMDIHRAPYSDACLSLFWNNKDKNKKKNTHWDWHFGFGSIQQLRAWLDHHPKTHHKIQRCNSLFLSVYEIGSKNDIQDGEMQCVFYSPNAMLVRQYKKWDNETYKELMLEFGR